MSLDAMKQALEALENVWSNGLEELTTAPMEALRAAIEQATCKQPLQVPPEVVASLTTTDIAWLATHRLTNLWMELGQMRWAGADESWDLAIEAVRNRINDECQSVLHWKEQADQSQLTAIELLQKMQRLESGR